jgi:hypothetical protein
VRRCIGFAKEWGFGGLLMLNAYGLRSTKPAGLWEVDDPVGPDHDERLTIYRDGTSAFVAAWGVHCDPSRAMRVCQIIGRPIDCLGLTKNGAPRHPLYLKSSAERMRYVFNDR